MPCAASVCLWLFLLYVCVLFYVYYVLHLLCLCVCVVFVINVVYFVHSALGSFCRQLTQTFGGTTRLTLLV